MVVQGGMEDRGQGTRARTWVCEPDVTAAVDDEVVYCVEVVAEVVVEKRHRLVGVGIERSDTRALLGAANRVVTTRGS